MGEFIKLTAADGHSFDVYKAMPSGKPKGAMLVIQEIFGVNQVMREICDDLAAQGYLALCPDLFWRQEPGIQITDKTDEEWAKAFELYKGFSEVKGVNDLIATLGVLRETEGCNGLVGTLGYCLGGKLAYLMATRSNADCSVSYYGVGIEKNLDEASAITKPYLAHIAEKDQFVPPPAQQQIRDALSKISCVTAHTYPGCDHAFARVGGAHYNKQAADLANQRTAAFLKEHLTA